LIIVYVCRIYMKKRILSRMQDNDINDRINTVVTSYMAMREK
jgi:hypothetical protein